MNRISSNYEENVQWFNDVLGAGRSCDMVCRDLYVGGRRARFWVIDGFGGDASWSGWGPSGCRSSRRRCRA